MKDVATRRMQVGRRAPLLEALVRCQDGGAGLVAAGHELKEEHRPGAADGQVADLIDDQQAREDEGLEAVGEPPGLLGLLERGDQVRERAAVDPATALGRSPGGS